MGESARKRGRPAAKALSAQARQGGSSARAATAADNGRRRRRRQPGVKGAPLGATFTTVLAVPAVCVRECSDAAMAKRKIGKSKAEKKKVAAHNNTRGRGGVKKSAKVPMLCCACHCHC